tara:strand:+ start:1193 stop:1591 length:399 start_codon:yes stop_codon:yes gene_type:complete
MGFLGNRLAKKLKKKLGINKIAKQIKEIDSNVDQVLQKMPRKKGLMDFGGQSDMIGPGTNAPGAEAPESGEEGFGEENTTGVTEGGFAPNTLAAADNMFGQNIEGSFDKSLGQQTDGIGSEVAEITSDEDTI